MTIYIRFFLFLCLCYTPLYGAHSNSIQEKFFQEAQAGDYWVLSFKKHYSFILLKAWDPSLGIATLEEVSLSWDSRDSQKTSWLKWYQNHAPEHELWLRTTLDLKQKEVVDTYCLMQQAYIALPERNHFLMTLLFLNLTPVPEKDRRRLGPIPHAGDPDNRPLWQPKLTYQGTSIPNTPSDAYDTRWPKCNISELSEKKVRLYFPASHQKLPAYFPYFIEMHDLLGRTIINVVDSGRLNLKD